MNSSLKQDAYDVHGYKRDAEASHDDWARVLLKCIGLSNVEELSKHVVKAIDDRTLRALVAMLAATGPKR